MNTTTTRPKCQIIPIEEYDRILKVVAEDESHRYALSDKGCIIKSRRKNCFSCPESARFVIVIAYRKHKVVERFCREHASDYGELPESPQLEECELSDKQKMAIQAMQKWTSIKVRI